MNSQQRARPRVDPSAPSSLSASQVSYEGPPVAEVELDGFAYRVDAGRGAAVAISRREMGSWDWTPWVEGHWNGRRLRAPGLDHELLTALAAALSEASRERRQEEDT